MEHNDTIYRCINADCGRAFPRRVNFCPWCGTAQHAGARPAPVGPVLAKAEPQPVAATRAATAPPTPQSTPVPPMATPAPPMPAAPIQAKPAAAAPSRPAASPLSSLPPLPPIPPVPPVRGGAAGATPRTPAPSGRKPIRLRWWLIALGALWLAWMLTKPTEARIERRMKAAIALAQECKPREAQDALIALRKTRAKPQQLRQVQDALNEAAAACTRAERRRSAWKEASAAAERLLNANSLERARSRLSTFTKRWGEDEQTRELRRRIDAERHPLADPSRSE